MNAEEGYPLPVLLILSVGMRVALFFAGDSQVLAAILEKTLKLITYSPTLIINFFLLLFALLQLHARNLLLRVSLILEHFTEEIYSSRLHLLPALRGIIPGATFSGQVLGDDLYGICKSYCSLKSFHRQRHGRKPRARSRAS